MKFFDADAKRPLASVGAIVDEGNLRRVWTTGFVHREHEHGTSDSNEEEEWRVRGTAGRARQCENDEEGYV